MSMTGERSAGLRTLTQVSSARPRGAVGRVLLVEDDPADALLTVEAFAEHGLAERVTVVPDGVAALDVLRRATRDVAPPAPDLVLLDLNLPRLGGREVLQRIKRDPALRSIPVVILSTSTSIDDVRSCYADGANTFISKPEGFGQLLEVVAVLVDYWFHTGRLPR